jgi:hypothetical protein
VNPPPQRAADPVAHAGVDKIWLSSVDGYLTLQEPIVENHGYIIAEKYGFTPCIMMALEEKRSRMPMREYVKHGWDYGGWRHSTV